MKVECFKSDVYTSALDKIKKWMKDNPKIYITHVLSGEYSYTVFYQDHQPPTDLSIIAKQQKEICQLEHDLAGLCFFIKDKSFNMVMSDNLHIQFIWDGIQEMREKIASLEKALESQQQPKTPQP